MSGENASETLVDRDFVSHPIQSLLSTLSSHLPAGWSVHRVDGNPFAFVLSRAAFDSTSWTSSWTETVLLQVGLSSGWSVVGS